MDIQNILITLLKSMQNSPNEEPQMKENFSFDDSFFKLPNYEEKQQNTENKNYEKQGKQNGLDISVLINLLPQILPLFQQKPKTKIKEDIPSYISSLHKMD